MLDLLLKPTWNYRDIMAYAKCGKTKAFEIMRDGKKKYGGCVQISHQLVRRDSVLIVLGTSIEREIYILNQIKKGGVNEKV